MDIGVYGGTFNPVHFGHLRTAEEIGERFQLRQVIFIPSAHPPHKDGQDIIDPWHRLKMLDLAVTGNPRFATSDLEIQRRGKSYSIDTVRALREQRPEPGLAFILGLDAFLELHTWHRYQEIFAECDFIVTTRPGAPRISPGQAIPEAVREAFHKKKSGKEFEHVSGRQLVFTEVTELGISGSAIRELCRLGLSLRYLLPRRVAEYIHEHKLYQ